MDSFFDSRLSDLSDFRFLESSFPAIFLHFFCACRSQQDPAVIFFDCKTLAVCDVPSSRLAGEFYSNVISTFVVCFQVVD